MTLPTTIILNHFRFTSRPELGERLDLSPCFVNASIRRLFWPCVIESLVMHETKSITHVAKINVQLQTNSLKRNVPTHTI